ncbi:MAG TPA: ribonuclease P protein component [Candidatus Methylomirabilis sp.]|nr:ribonuclease P protein component [Candidatus Methylomirabilis sp.]
MLPRLYRLRHEKDFARLSVKGRPMYGPFCILRAWKSGSIPSKIGFVASGKIFKSAVSRNRARRRLREAFRPLLKTVPPGYDMTFVAKPEVLKADFNEIRATLVHLIEKLPVELARPWKRLPKPPRSRKGEIGYAKVLGVPRPPPKPPQERKSI